MHKDKILNIILKHNQYCTLHCWTAQMQSTLSDTIKRPGGKLVNCKEVSTPKKLFSNWLITTRKNILQKEKREKLRPYKETIQI